MAYCSGISYDKYQLPPLHVVQEGVHLVPGDQSHHAAAPPRPSQAAAQRPVLPRQLGQPVQPWGRMQLEIL